MKNYLFLGLIFFMVVNTAQAQYARDHVSIAVGPSILYGENAGYYSKFRVKSLPAITLSYSYDLDREWDIRTNVGIQRFDGAGIQAAPRKKWIDSKQAYDVKGQAYFIDLMPVYQFNPVKRGSKKHLLSYYAGLGLGVMHVQREAKIGVSAPAGGETGQRWNTVIEDQTATLLYIPARVGISTNLFKEWDFGLEGSLLTAVSDGIDGNNIKNKKIKPDMLVQLQFVVKRNINIW